MGDSYGKDPQPRLNTQRVTRGQIRNAVRDLFVNGNGEHAERLVLTAPCGKDIGGWCEKPLVDRLCYLLGIKD